MASSRMADQLGRVLGSRYRLVAPVGTGASAQVFVADDLTLGRRVAVKVLHAALADDEKFLGRFRSEARSAAALSHPNLMAVYDWGEDDTGPYIVTEYLAGGSLKAMLDAGNRLTPSQALMVGLEAARALEAAHRRGFVHRDIKPANLLFGDDGRLRIADFGLARALSEAGWTEPGDGLVGTARYAAPEQAKGSRVDGKADLYALGLVLIEAVTGTVPLTGEGALGTLMARVDTPVPVPAELGPLVEVCERLGRPDPDERPDAAELGRLLVAAARDLERPAPLPLAGTPHDLRAGTAGVGVGVGETTALVLDDVTAFGGDATTVFGGTVDRQDMTGVLPPVPAGAAAAPTRGRRWPWFLLAILVLAAAGAGIGFALRQVQTPTGEVPNVDGRTANEAAMLIAEAEEAEGVDWQVVEEDEFNEGVEAGVVISQTPAPGTELDDGSEITLVVSKGPPPVATGLQIGLTRDEAVGALEAAGLVLGQELPQPSEDIEAGRLLGWRYGDEEQPAEVVKGESVDLVVSSGPAPREVPSLAGKTFDEAVAALEGIQLSAERAEEFSDDVPEGQVIRTEPGSGEQVDRGSSVRVVVSKGPDLVVVPDVIGMTLDEALGVLESNGFNVEAEGPPRGRVFETDPGTGERVRRGSTVTIYLRR